MTLARTGVILRVMGIMSKSSGKTILVVDDDKNQRTMLAFALRDEGYLVVAVDSGALALELVKKERFDAAVCDVVLGDVDGTGRLSILVTTDDGRLRLLKPHKKGP